MMSRKIHWLAGASLAMLSHAAIAQTATPAARPAPSSPSDDQGAAPAAKSAGNTASAGGSQEIVVTGSRVITNGNNSPTPVTVLATEKLAMTTPSNVADGLRKLPVFGNSRSSSNLGNAGGNNVGNYLNLRAFGVIRTLVLFNGHRLPATASDGTIDVNTLPQMLVQRVDVVTGGASAVYGSDAVTGVVNYVLDTKFNGVKGTLQDGISQYGDAGSYRAAVAAGTDLFGGRGHFEASYERYQQNGISDKFDREAGRRVYLEAGNGTTVPYHLIQDARQSNSSFGGLITSGVLSGMEFANNNVLTPFVHGTPSGTSNIESGGDGAYNIGTSATAALQTDQAFGRFDFDVTDDIHWYAQLSWAQSHNSSNFGPPLLTNYTIAADNAFLPDSAKAAMAAAGETSFKMTRTIADEPQFITHAHTTNIDVTTGLDGKLGAWNWELYYTHGRSSQHVVALNNINNGRLAAALDAVVDPATGQAVCRSSLTNPGAYPGCIPIDLFGPTAESKAAYGYVTGNTQFTLVNKTDDVGGDISGSPFSTWAGPVKVALSGEFRHIQLSNTTNADPNSHPDCTGLPYNCSATTVLWVNNTRGAVDVGEDISEAAIEANIPILRDVPFVKSLDINGAFRFAHYSVSGNAKTWKVGGDWHVTDELSFRATRSQDIRAPTLYDLFQPITTSFTGFNDLHTNVAQGIYVTTQGNPNLKPEVAQTLTFGAVFKPRFIPGFSISVDYYNIKINNAITTLGGNSVATEQQCEQSDGTSPLCAFYVRPLPFSDHSAANFPTAVTSGAINAASTRTKGIDGEINYQSRLHMGADDLLNGMLSLRGLVSYQPVLETTQFAGAPAIKAAGVAGQQAQAGVAKIRATVLIDYTTDHWALDIQERWRSHLAQNGTPGLVFLTPKVPAAAYTDMTLTSFIGHDHRFEFFLSIQNLLNKKAPVFIATNFSSNPNFFYPAVDGDDILGRYFTSGVRVRF
jgi:outer membrane receptor protein involved in Fe transport